MDINEKKYYKCSSCLQIVKIYKINDINCSLKCYDCNYKELKYFVP